MQLSQIPTERIVPLTLLGEARGQGRIGMQAVMNVITNRTKDKRWNPDYRVVCLQPKQFSCWNPKDANYQKLLEFDTSYPVYNIAEDLFTLALAGTLPDITKGATHYFNPGVVQPAWAQGMERTVAIGQHVFYK